MYEMSSSLDIVFTWTYGQTDIDNPLADMETPENMGTGPLEVMGTGVHVETWGPIFPQHPKPQNVGV